MSADIIALYFAFMSVLGRHLLLYFGGTFTNPVEIQCYISVLSQIMLDLSFEREALYFSSFKSRKK